MMVKIVNFFFFKQKTAYEMRISDWSSDVCSSDLARRELLESLADFDDGLLEQLLEDKVPASAEIYEQLSKDLADDLIVPVLFGSAEQGHGITRLWKALRHETPDPAVTAARLGIPDGSSLAASVIRTYHAQHTGKMSIARIWRSEEHTSELQSLMRIPYA